MRIASYQSMTWSLASQSVTLSYSTDLVKLGISGCKRYAHALTGRVGPYNKSTLDTWNATIAENVQPRQVLISVLCQWWHLADPPTHQAVNVTLRVEGKTTTIFEGPVSTTFHRISAGDEENAQKYHCNGLNNDKNPCPGPTCTTALDDGSRTHRFSYLA